VILGILTVVVFLSCCAWKRRNDGDYTIVNQAVTEDEEGCLHCSIDLLHIDNGKLLKDLKVSWKHQVLCANPIYSIRIKKGILYLFKKGYPDYAKHETWILLERKDADDIES
jgi:hypothetical protein